MFSGILCLYLSALPVYLLTKSDKMVDNTPGKVIKKIALPLQFFMMKEW